MFVPGTGRPCTTNVQVFQGAPDYALDCSTCVRNIVNASQWHMSSWGRQFYGDGSAQRFCGGGDAGEWFGESLM